MDENYYIYIITNKYHGTLYIGITNDLPRRIAEHKSKAIEGFSQKYNLTMLVYYEHHTDKWSAAERERKLKNWKRQWKIDLIEKLNPDWKDLYKCLF
ncbi:MAG: GIY-YIG nuclease family protein [Alphaproteobacteria bacterium]|nr:GIY-YIG nuclease family protein [Alphaproteobacteria bacterium]